MDRDAHAFEKPVSGLRAFEIKRQHAAKPREQIPGDGVGGVGRETRIVGAPHLGSRDEELGQLHGVGILPLDPQDERLETPFKEKAGVGIERASQMVLEVAHLSDPRSRTDDNSGDDVAVTV